MADKKNPEGEYRVGYGRPPKDTQFKKGQSGNPKGRKKGTKNLKTDLLDELGETMKIREGGRERHISKQRALIKTLVARALNGNDRAAAKVMDIYLRVVGLEEAAAELDMPLTEDEREVIANLEDRLRRRAGLPGMRPNGKVDDGDLEHGRHE